MSGEDSLEKQERNRRMFARIDKALAEREAKIREIERNLSQQVLLASGTVGAIAFAGLVFIIQSSSVFGKDFGTLVFLLGLTSVLEVFSVIASTFVGSGITREGGALGLIGFLFATFGFGFFALSVMITVNDAAPMVATGFTVVFIAALVVFFVALLKTPFGGKTLEETVREAVSDTDANSDVRQ